MKVSRGREDGKDSKPRLIVSSNSIESFRMASMRGTMVFENGLTQKGHKKDTIKLER